MKRPLCDLLVGVSSVHHFAKQAMLNASRHGAVARREWNLKSFLTFTFLRAVRSYLVFRLRTSLRSDARGFDFVTVRRKA